VRNIELTRALLEKHGVDRYPTPELNLLKVVEELGEVTRALLRGDDEKARDELADVAISLYALSDKLGFDLDERIRLVVEQETRSFVQ
jgi:NTP pyrophosphatase (non-canonical NTP hydrolase)